MGHQLNKKNQFRLDLHSSYWPTETMVLIVLALSIHLAILKFYFPGFYNPLWPHHSDFYIPAALAEAQILFTSYLAAPRPVGTLFYLLIGQLGIRGSIAASLLLVIFNATLTAMILRRITGAKLHWFFLLGYVLYLILLFSHPYQYVFSTYDVFSQLSYFLLACGLLLIWNGAGIVVLFVVFSMAFLAKETFALSASFLWLIWWFLNPIHDRGRILRVGASIGLSLLLALLLNRISQSPFIGGANYANSPYEINLSLTSLLNEWLRYALDGMSIFVWVLIGILSLFAFIFGRRLSTHISLLAIVLPIAAVLAWLPNSALPNHHDAGYSWNSSYLMFAPIMLIYSVWDNEKKKNKWAFSAYFSVGICTLASPLFSATLYSKSQWVLDQQQRQKTLLSAVTTLFRELPDNTRSILVSGINFPFSPFDHGTALYSLRHRNNLEINVVSYSEQKNLSIPAFPMLETQPTPVTFVSADAAYQGMLKNHYDEVWMFRENGSLLRKIHPVIDSIPEETTKMNKSQMVIFPATAEALGIFSEEKNMASYMNDGYHLLNCGASLITYYQPTLALSCLQASRSKIPENPYPYFYSGVAMEQLGQNKSAQQMYALAISHDDPKSPNPAFEQSLLHVEKSLKETNATETAVKP